ncbi:hypothetical protein M513_08246 [Trichuris suis]|uniref:Uncharacterized protein n=1 Tax=Trichuris suis TaxID=68888 RepID=A0A085M137_9BILA|nr:hypothetical protein M513_08246 [Trichuris suis]
MHLVVRLCQASKSSSTKTLGTRFGNLPVRNKRQKIKKRREQNDDQTERTKLNLRINNVDGRFDLGFREKLSKRQKIKKRREQNDDQTERTKLYLRINNVDGRFEV